ncbi:ExbD/TolR family protein [Halofilum ochraceum]|uniref:ExbD/TolR family protein n=1 Tax=Halofilum ochraceum TaxID=1611323 RepID=UPI0008DA5666|nr:biopolymer transporter ExbD [Halofilum ochraceum]
MNFRTRQREELELNITPLIDIVFLLLIFFMVSTTFQKQSELEIQLPKAQQEATSEPPDPLEIVISADGQYAIGGRKLSDNSLGTLIDALGSAAGDNRDRPLIVRADARTPHQAVVRAMDAASKLGLDRLSIATARDTGAD